MILYLFVHIVFFFSVQRCAQPERATSIRAEQPPAIDCWKRVQNARGRQ